MISMAALVGVLACGCTNMENKMGRGLDNSMEIVRCGELRRSVEQTALFDSPDEAYTTGVVRGFDRTPDRFG